MGTCRARHLACTAAALLALAAPAAAQTHIVLHDIDGVAGSPADVASKIAAHHWAPVLTNNATIHIDVGLKAYDPGNLGMTGFRCYDGIIIASYENALAFTGNSALYAQAASHFQPLSSACSPTVLIPAYGDPIHRNGAAANGSTVALTSQSDGAGQQRDRP